MKTIITSTFLGAIALALPAMADKPTECSKANACITKVADANVTVLKEVSVKITAQPTTAGEVVKQAILDTKATTEEVLQIVKAAVVAAPEQAEAIRKVAVALAPEAEEQIEIVIASVLQGDQVADANKPNGGDQPEGNKPNENTVHLDENAAHREGNSHSNQLSSKVSSFANSYHKNHNTDGRSENNGNGGGTVVVRPVTPNGL